MFPTSPHTLRAFFTLILASCSPVLYAQNTFDSLRVTIDNAPSDSARARLLNELAESYADEQPDSTVAIATRAAAIARASGPSKLLADALKNIGDGHERQGAYAMAASYFTQSMEVWKDLGNEALENTLRHALGNAVEAQGDFPGALELFLTVLKHHEAVGDSAAIANMESTIGNVYSRMGDHEGSIARQEKALGIFEALRDTFGMARTNLNLGTAYDILKRHDEALGHMQHALELARRLGNPYGEAICLGSIANHYQRTGELEQALAYNRQVIALFEQLGDPFNQAAANINTGEILTQLKRYAEARTHLERGLELAKGIGAKQWIANAYSGLVDLAAATGAHEEALDHYRMQVAYDDSISNDENTRKAVQVQMQYDFDKKEAATQAEQEKKDQRQRMVRNTIAGGLAFALLFLGVVWRQRNKISKARKRSDELLLNILPEEVAEELKETGAAEAKHFETATILFTDFKGFTQLSELVTPTELVEELNTCFKEFDALMTKYRIEKIKTIGDAYMAAGGLPDPQHGSAADVVRAALEMQEFMKKHKAEREAAGKPFFEMRVGIHSGPVVAGIVGVKKFQYDIWGDTVNTASRMESSGEVGQVNISEATYALVKDAKKVNSEWELANGKRADGISSHSPFANPHSPAFTFTPRGKVQAKGKGEMEMYFVTTSDRR